MPLCIPRIVSLVSEWSRALAIESALPGARVVVRAGSPAGPVVLDAVASGGFDYLALDAGASLQAGDALVAQQRLGPDASDWTDPVVASVVGAAPADHAQLAAPAFVSRLFDFSERLWISGTFPGSEVDIVRGSTSLGNGPSGPEGARLKLTPVMRAGWSIKAMQRAPAGSPPVSGVPNTATRSVQALPVPFGLPLPPPQLFGPPPVGCDAAVPVGAVIDGAQVTVARVTEGGTERADFDAENLWFLLTKPLDPGGGKLEITQAFTTQRETLPSQPLLLAFAPAVTPALPIVSPLCGGTRWITVSALAPGALVTITVTAPGSAPTVYRGMAPPTASSATFEVPPLAVGATISVVQERCTHVSPIATATVDLPGEIEAIGLAEPLYECARVVRVVGAHPGARLRVWTQDPDGRRRIVSEQAAAAGPTLQCAIAPFLARDQVVWVEQYPCGGPWQGSDRMPVQAAPPLFPPGFSVPPIATGREVTVDAVPGAFVEVYAQLPGGAQELIGAGCVDPLDFRVALNRPLGHEAVYARQTLCGTVSRPGPAAETQPGERLFSLSKAKKWPVVTKDVEWKSGTLTVRHNGSWEFVIAVENKDTKGDVDMDLQVSLALTNPKFGTVILCPLASPPGDIGFQLGRANHGIPAADTKSRVGEFDAFRDAKYWVQVLSTTAKFEWFVAVTNYSLPKPKSEEKKPESGVKGK